MNVLTTQQVFTKAATGLLKQNAKSQDPNAFAKTCMYRGPEGRKCGAGFCIDDEHYSPELEGLVACNTAVARALKRSGVQEYDLDMLLCIQDVHDHHEPSEWNDALTDLAERFKLEMPSC